MNKKINEEKEEIILINDDESISDISKKSEPYVKKIIQNKSIDKKGKKSKIKMKKEEKNLPVIKDIEIHINNKKRKEELDSESQELDKEIETTKAISKEKKSNENFLNNFDYEYKELQNAINKLEKKIKPLEQQCETLTKDIENYKNELPNLKEKAKIPRKNQEKMSQLEKEI